MAYIFGGNTGNSYEDLKRQRKALEQRQQTRYAPTSFGGGLSALGHALGTRIRSGALDKADAARRGQSDNDLSAFRMLLGGGGAPKPSGNGGGDYGAFNASLAHTESGGRYDAQNSEGYSGKYQFGQARLDDFNRANGSQFSTADLLNSPELQEQVQNWHVADIDNFIDQNGLSGYVGQNVGGTALTQDSLRAMAHLGGKGGMKRYVESGGRYNPADSNGTSLSDYARTHAGQPQAQPREVASLDATWLGPAIALKNRAQQPVSQMPMLQQRLVQKVAGGAAPTAQPTKPAPFGGVDPRVFDLMANPAHSPERRSMMQHLLKQHVSANTPPDPMKQIKLQKAQLELDQMKNPDRKIIQGADGYKYYQDTGDRVLPNVQKPEPQERGYQMLTPDQVQQMGLPAGNYQQGPQGRVSQIGGGGTNVTVNSGAGETAFAKETGRVLAKSTNEIATAGHTAQRNLNRIDRLEELLKKSPTGFHGAGVKIASDLGIHFFDGEDDIQAAQALINSMVPEQRPAGSGPMSDADLALFKQSLPRIINSKGGNDKIIQTLRGVAQYDIQSGEIARRLQLGEISPEQAFGLYGSLENPLGWLNSDEPKVENNKNGVPHGVDSKLWEFLTPEERALWD